MFAEGGGRTLDALSEQYLQLHVSSENHLSWQHKLDPSSEDDFWVAGEIALGHQVELEVRNVEEVVIRQFVQRGSRDSIVTSLSSVPVDPKKLIDPIEDREVPERIGKVVRPGDDAINPLAADNLPLGTVSGNEIIERFGCRALRTQGNDITIYNTWPQKTDLPVLRWEYEVLVEGESTTTKGSYHATNPWITYATVNVPNSRGKRVYIALSAVTRASSHLYEYLGVKRYGRRTSQYPAPALLNTVKSYGHNA